MYVYFVEMMDQVKEGLVPSLYYYMYFIQKSEYES